MMLATKQVAKGLHGRFNEQNTILKKMDGTLVDIYCRPKIISPQTLLARYV